MLGLGKYQPAVCFDKLMVLILLQLCCAQFSLAQNDRILLRNGPGSAFSVVFEVPADHDLKPIRLQGEWLLLGDARKQGWAHRSDIPESSYLSQSQRWFIQQDPQISQWSLQVGGSSQHAVSVAVVYPWEQQTVALRTQRRAFGETAWQSISLVLETDVKRINSDHAVRAGASLGVGVNEKGSRHWSDEQKMVTTGLVGLNLDWQAQLNQQLSVIVRLSTEQSFSGNRANHKQASLIWNLKI